MRAIPIVDLSSLINKQNVGQENEDWNTVAQQVDDALSNVGFVYLINHGISSEKVERAFGASKKFFELPPEIKKKYEKDPSKTFHGYAPPGQELLNKDSKFELRESYDLPTSTQEGDPYPEAEVPEFKTSILDLKMECHPLINLLNRILAKALKLSDENYFVNASKWMIDDTTLGTSAVRSLYYPPVTDSAVQPGTVRCAEHTDYGTLTLLFQDEIGGLEVLTRDDGWISATPIPGAILVNTGDLLEFWSGGKFLATTHRVLIPEIELKKKVPRQSIVYFVHPDDSTIVSPLTTSPTAANYKIVTAAEHAMTKLNASYKHVIVNK